MTPLHSLYAPEKKKLLWGKSGYTSKQNSIKQYRRTEKFEPDKNVFAPKPPKKSSNDEKTVYQII